MPNVKKKQNFLVQGSILAVASILCRIIGIIYRVPLTNIISDAGMGYYNAAFEIYSILLIISSYSLPLAVSKLVSARVAIGEYKNAYRIFRYAMRFAICIGLIVGMVTFIGADLFANLGKYSKAALAIKTLAPTLLIMSIVGVFRGYYQGLGTMLPTAASNIFEQIINAIVSVGAAYFLFNLGKKSADELEYGAAGGTIGTGAGALTALIFLTALYFMYKKVLIKQMRNDTISSRKKLGNISTILIATIIPVILSTTVYNISGLLDGVIFSNVQYKMGIEESVYTALYGIYSSKYRVLMNVPIAIAASLASSIIPSLIASISVADYKGLKRKMDYSIRFSMIIAIPCAVGLAILAKPIILLLYSSSTPDVSIPVNMIRIGAISVIFYSMSTITNALLQGIDKMRIPVIHAVISVIVHIIFLVILLTVFNLSITGVVIADACFALLICILNSIALYKYVGFKQEIIKTFILPLISAFVMGLVTYVMYEGINKITHSNILGIGVSVIIAIVVYGTMLLILRVVNEEELLNLPKGHKIVAILSKLHMI